MVRRTLLPFIIGALLVSGGFVVGSYGAFGGIVRSDAFSLERRSGEETVLINPLLDCVESQVRFVELRPFSKTVEDLIESKVRDRKVTGASVYFRDLNNGPWFGINEELVFSPASLLKVPLAMAYYQYREYEPGIMEEAMVWHQDPDSRLNDLVGLEEGGVYTVRALIERMLVNSDNAATELLIRRLPPEQLLRPYEDLGMESPKRDGGKYQITARGYAKILRVLFNASYLTPDDSREVLGLLTKSGFTDGLRAGVPASVLVANKYGERTGEEKSEMHDYGIVYYPGHPYLLCVMTHGRSVPEMTGVIREISSLVYREVDAQFGH